jgi:hypothetical protein
MHDANFDNLERLETEMETPKLGHKFKLPRRRISIYGLKSYLLVALMVDAGYLVFETAQLVQRLGR